MNGTWTGLRAFGLVGKTGGGVLRMVERNYHRKAMAAMGSGMQL